MFFHQSEAPAGGAALGDALSFAVRADARSGKPVAVALRRLEPGELQPELRLPGGRWERGVWPSFACCPDVVTARRRAQSKKNVPFQRERLSCATW